MLLCNKMSVHIPIYKRILYDFPEMHSTDQGQGDSAQKLEALSIIDQGKEIDNMAIMEPPLRQTRSAPSLPLSSGNNVQNGQIIPRNLSSAPLISLTKLNTDYQSERWKERERHLTQSRTLKRTSNIIAHRQDTGYYISGSRLPLINKYDIEEEELIRLRMLAHSRAEKSTRTSSRNSSAFTRKFSPGGSPSGQNSSPVPTTTAAAENGKTLNPQKTKNNIKDEREKRRELQRRKEREKEKRLEEKARFEKEMSEKYKPKKPVQKSMIFITENDRQRTFLTDGDFMEDEEKGEMYSFINENQRNAFTSIFNDMDKNKDGKVDMDELKQTLFPLVSKKNLKYLLQVFDLNQDHTVDVREFVTICALNDKLCGIRTENETAALALDLAQLAQHITIYKELFNVVDEDGDGRVQPDEVLLLVITALEGENTQENTQGENTQGENTQGKNTEGKNTQGENTQGEHTQGENTQGENTQGGNTQRENTQEESTQGVNTQGGNAQGKKTKKGNQIDKDESKRVLDSIEKDENGFIDFVSFLSYIPFFTKLLNVIMDSPLSIASLEKTRDKVTRKLSKNTTQSS